MFFKSTSGRTFMSYFIWLLHLWGWRIWIHSSNNNDTKLELCCLHLITPHICSYRTKDQLLSLFSFNFPDLLKWDFECRLRTMNILPAVDHALSSKNTRNLLVNSFCCWRGHRILLFSQMSRMLDILQDYMEYRGEYD